MASLQQNAGLRVGLFGVGLDAYWPQFEGLEQRLKGYLERIAAKIARPGYEVVSLGISTRRKKQWPPDTSSARRRRHFASLRGHLRPLVNDPADRPQSQGPGNRPESLTRTRD